MTLNDYMNENFTVIDATSQGMSLQEAIEEVKLFYGDQMDVRDIDFVDVQYMAKSRSGYATAIATILNAVVKGELKV